MTNSLCLGLVGLNLLAMTSISQFSLIKSQNHLLKISIECLKNLRWMPAVLP